MRACLCVSVAASGDHPHSARSTAAVTAVAGRRQGWGGSRSPVGLCDVSGTHPAAFRSRGWARRGGGPGVGGSFHPPHPLHHSCSITAAVSAEDTPRVRCTHTVSGVEDRSRLVPVRPACVQSSLHTGGGPGRQAGLRYIRSRRTTTTSSKTKAKRRDVPQQ